jgi:SAM-dependent methyltransferase
VSSYFKLVYEKCLDKPGGMFIDIFSGGGRDIRDIFNLMSGNGKFVAIDSDPQRIVDMLKKEEFSLVRNKSDLKAAFENSKVAALPGEFPGSPYGNTGVDLDSSADFILCNAGIMFVGPEKLESTLEAMARMLAPGGEMVLRFSLERDDKKEKLGKSYFAHSPEKVTKILKEEGLAVKRSEDLPDPDSRPFSWVDIHCRKPEL